MALYDLVSVTPKHDVTCVVVCVRACVRGRMRLRVFGFTLSFRRLLTDDS